MNMQTIMSKILERKFCMLIKITVENFKSFDQKEELSMISSSKIQDKKEHRIQIKQTNILKNAVIYGANAAGKSNLVDFFSFFTEVLREGLPVNSTDYFCRNKTENLDRESFFELQFTAGEKFYAYGFSAVLSKRRITEEWLYELMQDGGAHQLFIREDKKKPVLGETVSVNSDEASRFKVYSEDFVNQDSQLFLTEMNRGKKYSQDSRLLFFPAVFSWLMSSVIVLKPDMGLANTEAYYNDSSLERITELIKTFDTGISGITIKKISMEELGKSVPKEILNDVFFRLKQQMNMTRLPEIKATWRTKDAFFNFKVTQNEPPEITTLILKHGKSEFDFTFPEESDGTKRLFDLIDMILTARSDTLFVVDELERSLHPKLTQHFLELFMTAHKTDRTQLVFTTHEASIMDQNLFRRDEIWFVERNADNSSRIYSLDIFKERYDKKLNKAYIEGRYGAVPVFRQFSFKKES